MNTDSFFCIGKTHNINQDYTINGFKDGVHYAIVCDGCSGSRDTDIGSRILARAALHYINKIHHDPLYHELVIAKASMQASILELSPEALDATLLIVAQYKDTFYVKMYGDGYVVVKYKDGKTDIHEAEFPQNAPYYLNYLERSSLYYEEYKEYINKFEYTSFTNIDNIGNISVSKTLAPSQPQYIWKDLGYPKDKIEYIAVMSDGVGSFDKKEFTESSIVTSPVNYIDIIQEITSFKNTRGEFVKRRLLSAKKKFLEKNIFHKDDLSIAVVYNNEIIC